jgi:hypothetical protein
MWLSDPKPRTVADNAAVIISNRPGACSGAEAEFVTEHTELRADVHEGEQFLMVWARSRRSERAASAYH